MIKMGMDISMLRYLYIYQSQLLLIIMLFGLGATLTQIQQIQKNQQLITICGLVMILLMIATLKLNCLKLFLLELKHIHIFMKQDTYQDLMTIIVMMNIKFGIVQETVICNHLILVITIFIQKCPQDGLAHIM